MYESVVPINRALSGMGALQIGEDTPLSQAPEDDDAEPRWKYLSVSCGFNHTAAILETSSNLPGLE